MRPLVGLRELVVSAFFNPPDSKQSLRIVAGAITYNSPTGLLILKPASMERWPREMEWLTQACDTVSIFEDHNVADKDLRQALGRGLIIRLGLNLDDALSFTEGPVSTHQVKDEGLSYIVHEFTVQLSSGQFEPEGYTGVLGLYRIRYTWHPQPT